MNTLQKILLVGGLAYVFTRKPTQKAETATGSTNGFTGTKNTGATGGGGGGNPTDPTNPPTNPTNGYFTQFELQDLKALVSGTNDISTKNTLGFEVFPDVNGQPLGNLNAKFLWGNGVEFLNHGGDNHPIALTKGLATGFDNCFLNSSAGVPGEHRYKWTLFNDYAFWNKTHAQLETEGANAYNAMKSQSKDCNGVLVPFKYTMLDIEGGVQDFSKISRFVKGYYETAKADNPAHIVIVYGYKPNQGFTYWHNGYYYDGDNVPLNQQFFPFAKTAYNNTLARSSAGIITDYFKGKDIWYNVLVSYPKQNLPITSTMYLKDGSGNFIITDGQRTLRTDTFNEVQRGETINFSYAGNQVDITPQEANDYGNYRLKSAVYHAIHQFGGLYSELFYRLQMLANMLGLGYDFQNVHSLPDSFKTIGILRHDLEANPFTNLYRPIDRVSSDWFATMVYTMLNNLSIWTNVTGGNIGLTLNGGWINGTFYPNMNKSANEGQAFSSAWLGDGAGQPKTSGHLGNYRQWAAKMYEIQSENRVHSLWQKSDKILAFTNPEQIINGQFPLIGRMQGNFLKLHGIESKLEIGESFTIMVKNTKNAEIFTETIEAKKVFNKLLVLPGGSYNAQDIIVQYTNPVKGSLQKVNGRAENV